MLRLTIAMLFCLLAVVAADAPSKGWLLVANKADKSLGIIDVSTRKQVATVSEGGTTGHEVTASPDGRTAYVPIYGDSGVGKPGTDGDRMVVIDIASRKVTGTVNFGRGVRPHLPAIGPKNGLLYVSTELDQAITIIDPKTLKIVGQIPTGQKESHMFVISHDGRRGYTANVGPGTVSVLDMEAKKTIAIIPISGETQRISISPDDKWVFTSDQKQPRLAVIDTATNKVAKWVALPGAGYGTAPTPDGKFLIVDVPPTNQVAIVDLAAMKVVKTLDVPKAPQAVIVRPDGKEAYASCDASHQIAVIDTATWTVKGLIDAGNGADGLAWAN